MQFKLGGLLFLCWIVFVAHLAAQQGIAYHPNPHTQWYFLTPASYGPKPGKAIFQNGMIAASQYQKTTPRGNTYTIGMIPTLLLGESFMPIWVSGHRRIPLGGRKDHPAGILNVGGYFLSVPQSEEINEDRDFSFFYTNISFGSREKNFAIGGAIVPTGVGKGKIPTAISLHGMTRLGPRSCLLTENYIFHENGNWLPVSISGLRWWKKRTAFDFSILLTRIPASARLDQKSQWLPIPWIAMHRNLRFDLF